MQGSLNMWVSFMMLNSGLSFPSMLQGLRLHQKNLRQSYTHRKLQNLALKTRQKILKGRRKRERWLLAIKRKCFWIGWRRQGKISWRTKLLKKRSFKYKIMLHWLRRTRWWSPKKSLQRSISSEVQLYQIGLEWYQDLVEIQSLTKVNHHAISLNGALKRLAPTRTPLLTPWGWRSWPCR